jgi:lysozyme
MVKIKNHRILNDRLVSLLKTFEGESLTSYRDSAGYWTIGIGHLITQHKLDPLWSILSKDTKTQDLKLTSKQSIKLLFEDLNLLSKDLDTLGFKNLPINEYEAIASFVFNFGITKFKSYTLYKLINKKASKEEIANFWLKYHFAGGYPFSGLAKRRIIEACIYSGDSEYVINTAKEVFKHLKINYNEVTETIFTYNLELQRDR